MNQSVVIFGAGRFGSAIAEELFNLDTEVMIIDNNYDLIQDIANKVTTAVHMDLTDENAVEELGLTNFDVAVVAIGTNLESSILATMIAKDHNIHHIIAKAVSTMQARILEKIGADTIIFPELDMGKRLARSLTRSNILEYIRFSEKYSLVEVKAEKKWIGKTLIELDFRNSYQLNVVGVKKGSDVHVTELQNLKIEKDDVLFLIGETKMVDRILKNNL